MGEESAPFHLGAQRIDLEPRPPISTAVVAVRNKYLAENNKRCAGIPVSSAAEFERVLKRHWGLGVVDGPW